MRVRTAVAAGALSAAAFFPLAGLALADDKDCSATASRPDSKSESVSDADQHGDFNTVICRGIDGLDRKGIVGDNDGEKGADGVDNVIGADGGKGADGVDEVEDSTHGTEELGSPGDSVHIISKYDKGESEDHGTDGYVGKDEDSGPAPKGGVETGAGGTAAGGTADQEVELLLPLSLAGGLVALTTGGIVLVRRRQAVQAD